MAKLTKPLKPEVKPIKSAAGYLRVSQPSQAKPDKISLEQQEMKIKEYCQGEGWELPENHMYKDAGKSGASMDKRTEMQRLLRDANKGAFEIVITWDVTRFGRSLRDTTNNIADLKALEIPLVALDQGIDTRKKDKASNLQLNILNSIAEYEHETIMERTLGARSVLLNRGDIFLGQPPYGYQWNKEKKCLEHHPEQAPVYKRIVRDYLYLGKGIPQITIELNEGNAPRRRKGGRWHTSTVSSIFRTEAHWRGQVTVEQDGETFIFPCDPLISPSEWRDLQTRLRNANKRAGRPAIAADHFLLHRKLWCGVCGSKLGTWAGQTRKDGTRLRRYFCTWDWKPDKHLNGHPKCSFNSIRAEIIEDHVINQLCGIIRGEGLENLKNSQNEIKVQELTKRIEYAGRTLAKRRRALASLEQEFDEGDYPAKFYLDKKIELTNQITGLQLEHDDAEEQRNKIQQFQTETENFQRFALKYKLALMYLTDQIRQAPYRIKKKLIEGFFDGRASVPPDHDLSKMDIPWRYNLPVLREVLAELRPDPGPDGLHGKRGFRYLRVEELEALWDELLSDEDTVNSCKDVYRHGHERSGEPSVLRPQHGEVGLRRAAVLPGVGCKRRRGSSILYLPEGTGRICLGASRLAGQFRDRPVSVGGEHPRAAGSGDKHGFGLLCSAKDHPGDKRRPAGEVCRAHERPEFSHQRSERRHKSLVCGLRASVQRERWWTGNGDFRTRSFERGDREHPGRWKRAWDRDN